MTPTPDDDARAPRTVLITGASRGIGEAAARHFAAGGANVVLTARSGDDIERIAAEIDAAGGHALAVRCDVGRMDEVRHAVAAGVERFGALDVVINNAGTIEPVARLEDSDPDAWRQVVDVNLMGVYHVMHAAFPHLKRSRGVIVNLSSGAATGALEGWSHYCATKAAVLALTRCGHVEWGPLGVRVVGLSPGTVATDMQVGIRASGVNAVSRLDPSAHIPADDVARALAWLSTDAARHHDGTDFSIKTPEGRSEAGLEPR